MRFWSLNYTVKIFFEVVNEPETIGFARKYYILNILNTQSLLQNVRFNSVMLVISLWKIYLQFLSENCFYTFIFSVTLNIALWYCYAKLNLMKMKQDCEDRLLIEFFVV